MRLRKFSLRLSRGKLASFLVVGILSFVIWSQPRYSFLRGRDPVFADPTVRAYQLSGDSVELSRRIDRELTGQGFKRISKEQWPNGREVEYLSAYKMTHVILVLQVDEPRPVSTWFLIVKRQSKLGEFGSDVLRSLTFSESHAAYRAYRRCTWKECFANLKLLEGAQATWAIENPSRTNEFLKDADLFGPQAYIRVRPFCPQGGYYSLGKVGQHPHCSIPWHRLQ